MRGLKLGTCFILLSGLAACGTATRNKAQDGANAAAAADNGAAPTGSASAEETPVGPCPYRTRNWTVRVLPPLNPGGEVETSIDGQVQTDSEGRLENFGVSGSSRAPLLQVEAIVATRIAGRPPGQWEEVSASVPYDPAFTRVVIRCRGAVLAELPIARPQ